MRTQKETNGARGTHELKTAERGICQGTETNRPSEWHSPTGDGREWDLSGHGKKSIKQGSLTFWRRQRGEFVRTRERNWPSEGHSLPGDDRGTFQDAERN